MTRGLCRRQPADKGIAAVRLERPDVHAGQQVINSVRTELVRKNNCAVPAGRITPAVACGKSDAGAPVGGQSGCAAASTGPPRRRS